MFPPKSTRKREGIIPSRNLCMTFYSHISSLEGGQPPTTWIGWCGRQVEDEMAKQRISWCNILHRHTRMQLISIMYFPHYKFPGPSSSSSSHFTFPQSWFFNNKAPTAIYAHCSPELRTGWTETSPGWKVVKWRASETGTDKSYLSIYA